MPGVGNRKKLQLMEDLRWPEGLGSSVSDGCLAQLSKGPAEAALGAWLVMVGAEGTKLGSAFLCSHPGLSVGRPFDLSQPPLQSLRAAAVGVSVAFSYVLPLTAPFRLGSVTVC